MVRLSQCMIVKNEEDNIEQALSWGKDFLYEQIVIDTGSTDRTVEKAKLAGAKVYTYTWDDDFSAAKNYAIEQATGDWIAFLDADEYFSRKDAKKMLNFLQKVENNLYGKAKPHVISNTWAHLGDTGKVFSMASQNRIFLNTPMIRYKNKIHETLYLKNGEELRLLRAPEDIVIFHTGYAPNVVEKKGKQERNKRLLIQELEAHPKNYLTMSYLGDVYMSEQNYVEAEKIFSDILNHIDEIPEFNRLKVVITALMRIIVEQGDSSKEKRLSEIYRLGKKRLPHDADMDYWMGIWMTHEENWLESKFYLQQAIQELEHGHQHESSYIQGKLAEVFYYLTVSCQRLNDKSGMIQYSVLTLKCEKYTEPILKLAMLLVLEEENTAKNAEGFFALLNKIYDFKSNLKDKLFVYKLAKQMEFYYLEQLLECTFTEEEQLWLELKE